MADYGWITLEVWPWNDEWLAADEELRNEFDEVGLVDGRELQGASEGERVEVDGRTVLTGEMRGASAEILFDSALLETLRERGIAYRLVGDAKWEWDGDETFWHPGMAEPFTAGYGNSGRLLPSQTFDAINEKLGGVHESIGRAVTEFFAADPYAWRPPAGYAPHPEVSLCREEGE